MIIKNNNNLIVSLPYSFITSVLPGLNATYAKIYVYAYGKSLYEEISTKSISKDLNILESDVVAAFKTFEELELVQSDANGVSFATSATAPNINKAKALKTKKVVVDTRPEYSSEEIQLYTENNNEITEMFASAQENLGKLLTKKDLSILFSFYDWLMLPFEVIEFLIVYCAESNHTNLKYIESIAIDWHNKGINTLEKAKDYLNIHTIYRKIFKMYGIGSREPKPAEINFMHRWLFEYSFSLDIINVACDKTLMQINKPSLKYTDKILTDWLKAKVQSIEDIKKLDENFKNSKVAANPKTAKSKLANFTQRNIDFDEIEKIKERQLNR